MSDNDMGHTASRPYVKESEIKQYPWPGGNVNLDGQVTDNSLVSAWCGKRCHRGERSGSGRKGSDRSGKASGRSEP